MTTGPAPAGRPSSEEVGGRLASLFDAHGRMILGLCRFLLRDSVEADDATQQTFLSAYRSLLSGTEPRNPAPWLAEIARNECRARIAARMREPLPLAASFESSDYDPVDVADQTELIDELKTAIAELPDRQREAVVLRDLYGLSYREVATAMTVSVPVVESLLFRARRHLDRRLGTLPRLAQGALAVPLALRDELARSIPGFDAAAAGLGITGGGAAAGGIVAKLATLPATAKVATATTVAAVAVGGTAVTPQVIERHPTPARPASTVTKTPPSPAPKDPAASHSTPASEGGAVEIARREKGAASDGKPAASQEEDSAEGERDDALDGQRAQGSSSSEARETEVEADTETEAAEVETEDKPHAHPQGRTSRAVTPPVPKSQAPETEGESETDEDERPE